MRHYSIAARAHELATRSISIRARAREDRTRRNSIGIRAIDLGLRLSQSLASGRKSASFFLSVSVTATCYSLLVGLCEICPHATVQP
ncbi:MAG TPA: hypothetical protein VE987_15110 [Polyangiaceae bacterium]|nr:hypothetical protein [Polyangiaceae bacterium]